MSDGYVTQVIAKNQQGVPQTMDMVSLRDFMPEIILTISRITDKGYIINPQIKCSASAKDILVYLNNYKEKFGGMLPLFRGKIVLPTGGEMFAEYVDFAKVTYNSGQDQYVVDFSYDAYFPMSNANDTIFKMLSGIKTNDPDNCIARYNFQVAITPVTGDDPFVEVTSSMYYIFVSSEWTAMVYTGSFEEGKSPEIIADSTLAPLPEFPIPPNEE